MPKRSGRKSLAQTPAPKSERIYGSSKNVKESATATKAKNISLSEKTIDVLKDKLNDFKKENPRKKNIDLNDLKAVYRRGSGAYSSSHRPTITGGAPNSRAAWSYARVNKFLKKASGEKVKAAYVQDDDLMAKGGVVKVSYDINNIDYDSLDELFDDGYGFRSDMGVGEPHILLLEENKIIGCIFLNNNIFWDDSKDYEFDIVIKEDKRSKGYSKLLIDEMINDFVTNFKNSSEISANVINDDLSKYLVSKYGFVCQGQVGYKYENLCYLPREKAIDYLKNNGSNTTFDGNNPDIRYKDGGKLKTKNMEKGDCYVAAAEFAMMPMLNKINFIGKPYIVHAEVKGQGKIEGIRYGHAWVEDDVNVYDYSNGRQIVLPKQIYYMIGDVNTYEKTKYQRYTFSEARAKMLQTGTYGSWDIVTDFAEGGEIGGQDITCVNCGWNWNTIDSDPSDKYVCHKCNFDNTLFYDNELLSLSLDEIAEKNSIDVIVLKSELTCSKDYNNIYYKKGGHILKKPMTLEQISKKHGVGIDEIEKELKDGMKHELEHTDYKKVAETIALHHIAERPDYYEKLDEMEKMEEGGEISEIIEEEIVEQEIKEFLKAEKEEVLDVLMCSDTKIFKTMICKAKIENAKKRGEQTKNAEEKNVWQEVENIWTSCMVDIINNKIPEFKKGGETEDCGCGKRYSKGGLAYGNSHDKGGMPMQVKSTGQNIEIEGGEAVVNKRSMQMTDKIEFEGKRLTPCQVISKINEMGGGVKLKCEDVKEIIAEDGNF